MLKEYKEIWKKVSNAIKKEFDSNLVYIKKYLRTKIKSYKGKINKNFCNNKIPKEGSQYICLSVVLLDSIFKTDKNVILKFFLEECKYFIKEKKSYNYITDNAEICSDSDEDNSDEEIIEKIQTKKKILMKKILVKILVNKVLVKKSLMKKYYQKLLDYGRNYYLANKK